MRALELLAPARNADIGIAAIDCGADAVYIAGPDFGARKAAGNEFEDIKRLCDYAHKFGAKIFLATNISVKESELEELHRQMLLAQDSGVDAFIIRDRRISLFSDIYTPLHASTQCAIRTPEKAKELERIGCSRIVLERELSLEQIREIAKNTSCEIECFVHGALCVCYSGDCRLSEYIDGRSADRGECIQACRSLYDLEDETGKVLVKNKALLSLKDLKLLSRLEDLAEAGVCSFKIEGRLKNSSYVKNVVREYDIALNKLVSAHPDLYCRASYGSVSSGFEPDTNKTFNRGYTELYLDGEKGKWSSMDAPKSMGEEIGTIAAIKHRDRQRDEITIKFGNKGSVLKNGDGFAVICKSSICGFRADICEGNRILCKPVDGIRPGDRIFRNVSAAFEKEIESKSCRREIRADVFLTIESKFKLTLKAVTEDGRETLSVFECDNEVAGNKERAIQMLREGLSKRSEHFNFILKNIEIKTAGECLPLLSAAVINGMRRCLASDIRPFERNPINKPSRCDSSAIVQDHPTSELMRSKYCVKYELGICPVHQGAKQGPALFLVNNGRRLSLTFDCKNCEMIVSPAQK